MSPISSIITSAMPYENQENPLFEKIVLECNTNKKLPEGIDFSGSIALTRDTAHRGWMHPLLWIFQVVHAFFSKRKSDVNMAHGEIILGPDTTGKEGKENNYIVAHAIHSGVKTTSFNDLTHHIVTQLIIYRPKNPQLRAAILKYANQTVYDSTKKAQKNSEQQKLPFSYSSMIKSVFYNTKHSNCKPSERVMKQTAYLIADLVQGKQILDEKGEKPASFFCTPYAIAILKGAMLVETLTEEEKQAYKALNRTELANKILKRLENKKDELSKLFWENKACRLDHQYIMSGYAAKVLDKLSEEIKDINQLRQKQVNKPETCSQA